MKIGILLSALAAIGCGKKPVIEEPLCGGVTDKTDPKAPKVIESKRSRIIMPIFFCRASGPRDIRTSFIPSA